CTVTVVPKFDAFELINVGLTHGKDSAEDPPIEIPGFELSVEADRNIDGVRDLYFVTDTLLTVVLPPLIEVPDAHQTYDDALAAKIARLFFIILLGANMADIQGLVLGVNESRHNVPYRESQLFIDTFREEMNELLYPDPPLALKTLPIRASYLVSASQKSTKPTFARVAPDLAAHPDAGIFYIMRPQVDPPDPH
ncbi:hypothetical protein C0995_008531, partial [Termitomyces sp. Mi166